MKKSEENPKTYSVFEKLSTPTTPKDKREHVLAMIEAIELRRKFIKPKSFRKHTKQG
jgi:hypothetical protein